MQSVVVQTYLTTKQFIRASFSDINDGLCLKIILNVRMDCPTSEGTLLSAVHGRDRRLLRNIEKRDLQAAKKYGVRKRLRNKRRWSFTYADIVYITEDDQIAEVTSYVLPLQ